MSEAIKIYNESVRKVGEYIFNVFYKQEQSTDAYASVETDAFLIAKCLEKAEKIYGYIGNYYEIKRFLEFMNIVSPGFAKDFIEEI